MPLTPDRWHRLDELFNAAIDLPIVGVLNFRHIFLSGLADAARL